MSGGAVNIGPISGTTGYRLGFLEILALHNVQEDLHEEDLSNQLFLLYVPWKAKVGAEMCDCTAANRTREVSEYTTQTDVLERIILLRYDNME